MIVGGVALVGAGLWYWRRNRAAAEAARQQQEMRARFLANPELVAGALRAYDARRNSAGNLWKAINA